jgi:hypothetical protein
LDHAIDRQANKRFSEKEESFVKKAHLTLLNEELENYRKKDSYYLIIKEIILMNLR